MIADARPATRTAAVRGKARRQSGADRDGFAAPGALGAGRAAVAGGGALRAGDT